MRSRFLARVTYSAIAACSIFAVSGCAMLDHSNTMLFGTNTTVGLQVGTDASNVPSINVGYRRQEAVFLPLLANLKDSNGKFTPCPGKTDVTSTLEASCKFLARNGGSMAEDSYSVLASFGASFSANTGTGDTAAKGGLAQYFATGAAAQILALTGGAAVVAVGTAATASASQPKESALASLVGGPAATARLAVAATAATAQRNEIADSLEKLSDDDFNKKADDLSAAALGDPTYLRMNFCKGLTKTACIMKIRSPAFNEILDLYYPAFKQP